MTTSLDGIDIRASVVDNTLQSRDNRAGSPDMTRGDKGTALYYCYFQQTSYSVY
ncbi:hypothetical protein Bpfe_015820, partial [Biomphalaria pfeifferi]